MKQTSNISPSMSDIVYTNPQCTGAEEKDGQLDDRSRCSLELEIARCRLEYQEKLTKSFDRQNDLLDIIFTQRKHIRKLSKGTDSFICVDDDDNDHESDLDADISSLITQMGETIKCQHDTLTSFLSALGEEAESHATERDKFGIQLMRNVMSNQHHMILSLATKTEKLELGKNKGRDDLTEEEETR